MLTKAKCVCDIGKSYSDGRWDVPILPAAGGHSLGVVGASSAWENTTQFLAE